MAPKCQKSYGDKMTTFLTNGAEKTGNPHVED
jgi:hypothetical protein